MKNRSVQNKCIYVKYRNKLKTVLNLAKENFYESKFNAVDGNIRKTWSILNNITDRNKTDTLSTTFVKDGILITCAKEIVKHFNDYFVNIGPLLAKDIPNVTKHFTDYLGTSPAKSLAMFLTNSNEVIDHTHQLKNKSSFGTDGIPMDIIKNCIHLIAEPLASLINCSFRTGRFPDQLKIAKVCPIFKSGSKTDFGNYRPISILSSFFKIFEKIASNRLQTFLYANDTLTTSQYGFRPKHSTYMALLDMYDNISNSLDRGLYSLGIFIDLSKAFDTINHGILIKKLECYGVRGLALEWFTDYLSNRKQCVFYNSIMSDFKDVSCGVPQGSILGPLLFIIYINDIQKCSNLFKFILFADDTNLFASNNNLNDLMSSVNDELVNLNQWFMANKLSLNVKKTNYILFGRKGKNVQEIFCLSINGINIDRVEFTKFLGVYIDENLNWKKHASEMSSKISRSIGIMSKVKYILSRKLLKTLYFSLIHSYLNYCIIIWGKASLLALKN